jgi:integrase
VPLVKQAEAALKAYLKVRDAQPEYDEVFIARNGTSMDVRTVRYRIHKYYKEAGIKKKASVHTLRHTFSTHQIHNGLKLNQLKEVLGHRRMETTYKGSVQNTCQNRSQVTLWLNKPCKNNGLKLLILDEETLYPDGLKNKCPKKGLPKSGTMEVILNAL